ncbi:MAG: glycosyltransferase family 39 protein [Terriglobales bacterium]|jgi:4-amino-4-deoxy-L-arabinose transferase-like glycosyltransferase
MTPDHNSRSAALPILAIAAATVVIHALARQYGFHRDELATLEDARHLAWGFVAYPPVTPFFGRLSLILFGTSVAGFRFFASLAEAVALVFIGLMTRELGGRRGAQLLAVAAGVPFCLAGGALMQYVSFDYLCWVLVAYFVIRLLHSDDPRWWPAIGVSIGLGMMTKYTMGFFVIGIVFAVIATPARKYFASKWLWIGVALSIVVFLPNLIWQAQHHFISLDFLKHIHERDIRWGRTKGFLPDQLKITLLACPLWLAGLYYTLITPAGRRFRMLAWMYLVPLVLFIIAKGRGYYLAAAYPMLYAAGAVWGEQQLASLGKRWSAALRTIAWAALAFDALLVGVIAMPSAPVNSPRWNFALKINGDLVEELGWPELTAEVARIRDSLPAADRSTVGILAANYGEAGALTLYGPAYNLPRAMSGINSFYAKGYVTPPPDTLIVLGFSDHFRAANFASCTVAGHVPNPYNMENEETHDHPDIYLCRGVRQSWPDFWKDFQYYG